MEAARSQPRNGYRALLARPVPRRLALASVPADFADWLDYAAVVALLVYSWGEGPFVLAFFAVALALPYILVGPFAALLVDCSPLGRVLFLSNLGRGLATFALVFAPNPAVVLLLVFARGCVDSAFTPARQSAIQASTPDALLPTANGLHQAINQTSKIAGPAVGGFLLAVMPAQGVFGVNAVLSLIAALMVLGLDLPRAELPGEKKPEGFFGEMLAGVREFGRSRLLLLALIYTGVAFFAIFLFDALLALLTAEFGFDATAFGLSIAVSGAGGLVGALIAGAMALRQPLGVMAATSLLSGAFTIGLAVAAMTGYPLAFAAFLVALGVMGGSTAFMMVPYRTIIQRHTPPDRIARVYAAGEAVTMIVMLSAPFLGSLVATAYGTGAAFLAGGGLLAALGAITLVVLLIRRP
ncbi:MFS transporter [Pelagibacterium xiamenense]|uniref:MFS transporter n=1 Tax=Pelagibacterium xiamenense TaxID=2901140 RepID=UPI001E5F62BF|nr:MFS transporter [Pelagibacterium xiamenense]MCD7060961.1 MFS transporter [Pelagibacterium xiamenense]